MYVNKNQKISLKFDSKISYSCCVWFIFCIVDGDTCPFGLWDSLYPQEEVLDDSSDCYLASLALECLITEGEGTVEVIKKRGRRKKNKIIGIKMEDKPKRKRLNLIEPGGPFYCDSPGCGKFYCRRRELNRHKRYGCLNPPQFKCDFCPLRTAQRYNLVTHIRLKHPDQNYIGHVPI